MLLISQSIWRWAAFAGLAATFVPALAAGPAAGEPAFAFATTPGRLPKTVIPIHYVLDLVPDVGKLTFFGSELVDIEAAAVDGESASAITFQAAQQTVTFDFPHTIVAGRHQLRTAFAGRINRSGHGLFYVDYLAADGRKRMISSHLEP